jgi:hypothetical protein
MKHDADKKHLKTEIPRQQVSGDFLFNIHNPNLIS